jgi:hypothetical protein
LVALPDKPKGLSAWLWRTLGQLQDKKQLADAEALMAKLPADARENFDDE